MITIKQVMFSELVAEPNFAELLDRYAEERACEGLPHPRAKLEIYRQLEALEKIHFIAAYVESLLVGIINVLMTENPHYGIAIATTESYFVFREYRKTGAGTLLLREAERDALKWGSPGIFISAPFGSELAAVLSAQKDYSETGRTFFKRLAHD